jgi:hypothetical protein
MAGTQIQYRRGSDTQNDAFTGALGEITVDTTAKTLRVHDGSTAGGTTIATASSVTQANVGMKGYVDNEIANIPPGYSNVQVATYLPTYTGNVSAAYFLGDGSQLTGLPEGYSNVQTLSYLTTNSYATESYADNAVTTANVGIIGYIGSEITTANLGMKGYVDNEITTLVGGAPGALDTLNELAAALNDDASFASSVTNSLALKANIASPTFTTQITTPAIVKSGTNGVGDIGQSDNKFGTIYGLASSAQYADLAEKYISDKDYAPGTVVVFGGGYEITESTESHQRSVAGVISTLPAYLMNSDEDGLPVALQGRVPCKVKGPIDKGDLVVASDIPGVAQRLYDNEYKPGCVIGKALNSIEDGEIHNIEVVVGRV